MRLLALSAATAIATMISFSVSAADIGYPPPVVGQDQYGVAPRPAVAPPQVIIIPAPPPRVGSSPEQFAVNARRAPKRIFHAHPPDQYAQLRVNLRSPSLWARLPTPVAAKAGPVPTHERLGPDDCENLQD